PTICCANRMASCWFIGADLVADVEATGVVVPSVASGLVSSLEAGRLDNAGSLCGAEDLSNIVDTTRAPFISRRQPVSARNPACATASSSSVTRPAQLNEIILRSR